MGGTVKPTIELKRRSFLSLIASIASYSALGLGAKSAEAMGRTPLGGRISLHWPWSTESIDPHDLRDPLAALLGSALFDPVYALDAAGNPYPALALSMPAREATGTVVRLRDGLRTARGVPLNARDLAFSIERARGRGAPALLADIPNPIEYPGDSSALLFKNTDPGRLARALSSPLCALVPRKFNAQSPDGTGAFKAVTSARRLLLSRNISAARGPSYLDELEINAANDLRTSLREFEALHDDIGWLGTGLYGGRPGAVKFDFGLFGWVVLLTGPDAGSFHAPGIAQQLCDGLSERVAHLGLSGLGPAAKSPAWGGGPADLLVDRSCPQWVEIARAVASGLSRQDNEVTVKPISRGELSRTRERGKWALSLDFVRPVAPGPHGALISLATAESASLGRELARHPIKLQPNAAAKSMTSGMHVGVLGELRISGAAVPEIAFAKALGFESWDLAATYHKTPKR